MNVLLVSEILREIVKYLETSDLALLYATNAKALQRAILGPNVVVSWTLEESVSRERDRFEKILLENGPSVTRLHMDDDLELGDELEEILALRPIYSLRLQRPLTNYLLETQTSLFDVGVTFPELRQFEACVDDSPTKIQGGKIAKYAPFYPAFLSTFPDTMETLILEDCPISTYVEDEMRIAQAVSSAMPNLTTLEWTRSGRTLRVDNSLDWTFYYITHSILWILPSLTSLTLYPTVLPNDTFLVETSEVHQLMAKLPADFHMDYSPAAMKSGNFYIWPPNLRTLRLAVATPMQSLPLNLPSKSLEEFTFLGSSDWNDDISEFLIHSFGVFCNISTLVIELTPPQQELFCAAGNVNALSKSLRTLTIYTVELRLAIYDIIQTLTGVTSLSILANSSRSAVPGKPAPVGRTLQWPSFRLPSDESLSQDNASASHNSSSSQLSVEQANSDLSSDVNQQVNNVLAAAVRTLAVTPEPSKTMQQQGSGPVINFSFPSSLTSLVVDAPPTPHWQKLLPPRMAHIGFAFPRMADATSMMRAYHNAHVELRCPTQDESVQLPHVVDQNWHCLEPCYDFLRVLDLLENQGNSTPTDDALTLAKERNLALPRGAQHTRSSHEVKRPIIHKSVFRSPSIIVEHADVDVMHYTLVPRHLELEYAKKRELPDLQEITKHPFNPSSLPTVEEDAVVAPETPETLHSRKSLFLRYWTIPEDTTWPESITELTLDGCILPQEFYLSTLPPSLYYLASNMPTLPYLPPSSNVPKLRSLNTPYWRFHESVLSAVTAKTILHVECIIAYMTDFHLVHYASESLPTAVFNVTVDNLHLTGNILPDGMQLLDPYTLFEETLNHLPKSIKLKPSTRFTMTDSFDVLPDSLTTISFMPMEPFEFPPFRSAISFLLNPLMVAVLPRNLTTLELADVVNPGILQRLLPASLKHLRIGSLVTKPVVLQPYWPPALESLTILFHVSEQTSKQAFRVDAGYTTLAVATLPPTLTDLFLECVQPTLYGPLNDEAPLPDLETLELVGTRITDYELAELVTKWAPNVVPTRVEVKGLILSGALVPNDPSIEYLSWHSMARHTSSFLNGISLISWNTREDIPLQVPASITELDLVSRASNASGAYWLPSHTPTLAQLPPALTRLRIGVIGNPLTAKYLANVLTLKHLYMVLDLNDGISDLGMLLPRNLEELELEGYDKESQAPKVRFWTALPASLHSVSLDHIYFPQTLPARVSVFLPEGVEPTPPEIVEEAPEPAKPAPVFPSAARKLPAQLKDKRLPPRTPPKSPNPTPTAENTTTPTAPSKTPFQFGAPSPSAQPPQGFSFAPFIAAASSSSTGAASNLNTPAPAAPNKTPFNFGASPSPSKPSQGFSFGTSSTTSPSSSGGAPSPWTTPAQASPSKTSFNFGSAVPSSSPQGSLFASASTDKKPLFSTGGGFGTTSTAQTSATATSSTSFFSPTPSSSSTNPFATTSLFTQKPSQ